MRREPLRRAWMDWMMSYQRRAYSCPAFDCYAPCNGACPDPGCFPQGSMPMLAGLSGQRACKHKPHGIPHAWRTVFGWIGVSVHHPVFTDVGL